MQCSKTILITKLSFVNGSIKRRWARMQFAAMTIWSDEATFKVMVQWIDLTACTGRLKIWTFMWTRNGLQTPVCHPGVLRDCSSLKGQLLILSTSTWRGIHCAHSFNSSMANTTGSPTSPSWCQGIPQCEFPRPVDRRWGSLLDTNARDIHLKDSVYSAKPPFKTQRTETEQSCTTIPADTLVNVFHWVVRYS